MITAGARLRQLAGTDGAAGALLLMIGSGATAGAALVDYSGLPIGSAAEHLMVDRAQPWQGGTFGFGYDRRVRRNRPRRKREDELLWL
jgi:hypothetical protein